jgi:hypothetical protein
MSRSKNGLNGCACSVLWMASFVMWGVCDNGPGKTSRST